jgi:small subunit ribosomal protein S6
MTIHEYEMVYVTRPELSEDIQKELHEKLAEIINKNGGELLIEEKWGRRKLAYIIQKHQYANYFLLDYVGAADLPEELERVIRLDERFIRFLTVKLEDDVDLEVCKQAAAARHQLRLEKINPSS